MRLEGILAAIVTPMREDESVDFAGLESLIERMIGAGVNGIFCLGTSGEFYALSEGERMDVARACVSAAAGRVPVIAGAGQPGTREVIRGIDAMCGLGLAAVSVVTPYFVRPDQEQLYAHFAAIAAATEIPMLLYNIPGNTGVTLAPETVARISVLPGCVGIKDSSGDFEAVKAFLRLTRDFAVFVGSDRLILDGLIEGAAGAVAATTNIAPEVLCAIYGRYRAGDLAGARAAQEALLPLCDFLANGTVPGPLKQLTNMAGCAVGRARLPVTGLTGAELVREMEGIVGDLRAFR